MARVISVKEDTLSLTTSVRDTRCPDEQCGVTINWMPPETAVQRRFNCFLLEAIDDTLSSLGVPVKNTLYMKLENNFGMKKEDIPQQIDDFLYILHKIFGLGATRLELLFVKALQSKIHIDLASLNCNLTLPEWIEKEMSFKTCLTQMRRDFCC